MATILERYGENLKREFETNKRILTFDEYLELVEQDPVAHTRGAAQYILDTMDFFGSERTGEESPPHYKLFDMEFSDPKFRVVGQEAVQHEFYKTLQNFVKEGISNKLILLHGPNGSAKSSLIQAIMQGMEHYSAQPAGALYRFNWIFPVDKYVKGSLGLGSSGGSKPTLTSFAKLPEDEIAARLPCDLKDHPLFLFPVKLRHEFFERCLSRSEKVRNTRHHIPDYLMKGSLSQKNYQVFEALLARYKGDITKVLMHVQVERFYVSRRYRTAAVTIEPQMHVDAQCHQITADRSLAFLPPSLQSITLYELLGDLPDANRGLVDFADLLKRPVDTYKYLLIACEQGSVNVGAAIAFLDLVLVGSTNEVQLDAFKEFPDFNSFKARMNLVRVPYLLEYSKEQKIYDVHIDKVAGDKHVSPHVTFVAALWAVLTRLKKPNPSHYPSNLTEIMGAMTPLEKARLYDHGEMPAALTPEQRKLLKAALGRIRDEYNSVPYYEGRMGASAREIKGILYDAAQNPEYQCLSPLAVFKEFDQFTRHVSEYDFLKHDIKDGYHDAAEFIAVVRNEYLNVLDQEVRESMGVFEQRQYEDYLKKYIVHLSHVLKNERIKNPMTGKLEPPDANLIEEFEEIMDAPAPGKERDVFRHNVISAIGAYSLDHPHQPVDYRAVFPDFMKKLQDHYFEEQRSQMVAMHDAIILLGTDKDDGTSDIATLARRTLAGMQSKFKYCEHCAKQSILFLVKAKY